MEKKDISIVVAASVMNRGIGINGQLPWAISEDLKFFSKITSNHCDENKKNVLIMGRKTWDSIGRKPLKNRIIAVISSSLKLDGDDPNVCIFRSLKDSIDVFMNDNKIENIFICGGESIYKEALSENYVNKIYLTRVALDDIEFDTYFPEIPETFLPIYMSQTFCSKNISYDFMIFENKGGKSLSYGDPIRGQVKSIDDTVDLLTEIFGVRKMGNRHRFPKEEIYNTPSIRFGREHYEFQYLDLLSRVLENGVYRENRTGISTYSIFGEMMRFDLRESFPLLTTKKVAIKSIFEELIWFIKGDTNGNHLIEKKVYIWSGNGSKEYLERIGLGHREENDLGPIYGFQWRHFNGEYKTMHDDYTGVGVDQLAKLIDSLKNKPKDRRHILTAWNPSALSQMALPPCHVLSQFYVSNDNCLSCNLYQRSCDLGLGSPFNIASYAILTMMLAHVCDYKPGELAIFIGDAHIYENHLTQLKEQLSRLPRPFPQLRFKRKVENIEEFVWEDIQLIGYCPYPPIKMEMAV
ncbi:dihydrofolate reductase-thymidylate synthase [Cryptosporidium ubiquitum]|uniref:Bifunctional dihydrofolate reductase-thymidylate synthase n=1 Tax=Cryptosporidium ubiquitum TaxID=857276 RepID=A0A1J4MES7_9CRYT|nr:dihydrofolate reductase-thymidylate synthase [Cryptosporidium ubiquitum]OII72742.1 dihydrofolate reductase-thymidylate synthase [Cryptosporidium ubiquitum]